jgi:thiol reductant ABC exporter CydD subunit
MAAGSICAVGFVLLLSATVASVFPSSTGLSTVPALLVAMGLLAVVRAGTLIAADVLAQLGATRTVGQLRRMVLARIAELGPLWTQRVPTGDLVAVLSDGLRQVDDYFAIYRPARLAAGIVPPLVLLVELVLDPLSALVLILTGPVLLLLLAVIGGRTRLITERRFEELRWLGAFFVDMLQGLTTLKLFGRSVEQADTIALVSRRYARTTLEVLRTAFQTALVLEWAATVATAVVAVEAGLRLLDGRLSFDRALAVIVVTPEFFLPLRQLSLRYHAGTAGRTAAERVFTICDAGSTASAGSAAPTTTISPPDGPPVSLPSALGQRAPSLRFEAVEFSYPDRDPALRGVDLEIPAGTTLALVGPTAAGKTTIAWLLLRFAEPSVGQILVDDVQLGSLPRDAWLERVAWVSQRPHLFDGSIADNIRLGRPDASDADVVEAATRAHADAFIDRLPGGYEARVGERGSRLSGGQLQRVAIARAWLRDAPVVVMDEATAHLDERAESIVRNAATTLLRGRTALVISHRRRLAAIADRVAVIEDGRVVRTGTPDEVLGDSQAFDSLDGGASRLVAPVLGGRA